MQTKEITLSASVIALNIGRTGEKAKFQGRQVNIDLATLPAASIEFALAYGLKQYIADGTAGSEDQAGYDLGIDQRLKKLAEADFARSAGERDAKADTAEGLALRMVKEAIRAQLKLKGMKADADKITAAAKAKVAAEPKWLKQAEKELAARAALAEATDADDLLGDLLGLGSADEAGEAA